MNLCAIVLSVSSQGSVVWPPWDGQELWRWLPLAFGLILISYGLFRKQMTWPNYGSLHGLLFGETAKKRWQVIYKRTFFVLLGICLLRIAFSREPWR